MVLSDILVVWHQLPRILVAFCERLGKVSTFRKGLELIKRDLVDQKPHKSDENSRLKVELSSYVCCVLQIPIRVGTDFITMIVVRGEWCSKSIIFHADCKAMYIFQALAFTFEKLFQE